MMAAISLKIQDNIAVLTITRSKQLNSLNIQVLKELDSAVDMISGDESIRCLIVTGEGGKAFVAGADISEMKEFSAEEALEFGRFGSSVLRKIEQLRMPVIAAVNGYALGGGLELALACDIRIASANSVFGFPETGLGIMPGFGGTQRLPRIIGVPAAKRLIYTAVRVRADEALRLGIVDEVAEQQELMEKVFALARDIASKTPAANANAKEAVGKGLDLDIDTALELESQLFAKCFSNGVAQRIMNDFLEEKK